MEELLGERFSTHSLVDLSDKLELEPGIYTLQETQKCLEALIDFMES